MVRRRRGGSGAPPEPHDPSVKGSPSSTEVVQVRGTPRMPADPTVCELKNEHPEGRKKRVSDVGGPVRRCRFRGPGTGLSRENLPTFRRDPNDARPSRRVLLGRNESVVRGPKFRNFSKFVSLECFTKFVLLFVFNVSRNCSLKFHE